MSNAEIPTPEQHRTFNQRAISAVQHIARTAVLAATFSSLGTLASYDKAHAVTSPDEGGRSIPFSVRWSSAQGPQLDKPFSGQVHSQDELEDIWGKIDPQNPYSVPTADWNNSNVYLVAQGDQSQGNSHFEVGSVKLVRGESKNRVSIHIKKVVDSQNEGTSLPAILFEAPKQFGPQGEVLPSITVDGGMPISKRQQELAEKQTGPNTTVPIGETSGTVTLDSGVATEKSEISTPYTTIPLVGKDGETIHIGEAIIRPDPGE